MYLSLTLPTVASAAVGLPEHDVERLNIGLLTAVADTVPVHLVRPVRCPPHDGETAEVAPCQVHFERSHAPPFDWLVTICDVDTARSTLAIVPKVYVVVPSG